MPAQWIIWWALVIWNDDISVVAAVRLVPPYKLD
jgi:hypothetical protein